LRNILVIRFGSLGDLCLLGWGLSRLRSAHSPDAYRLTLVTKPAWAPLAEKLHGVDRVMSLPGPGLRGLSLLAGRLRTTEWDTVIDAHNNLRSRLLSLLGGPRATRRLDKDTPARLALLRWRRSSERLQLSMVDRFCALLAAATGVRLADADAAHPPLLVGLGAQASPGQPILGLAPGAQWTAKRWPQEHFARLLELLAERHDGPLRLFLGPREDAWYPGSRLAATAASLSQVQIVQNAALPAMATALAQCSLLVTNDSGLLHVAEAVGTPVVALFGPTVREFGYFPRLPASRVLERELDCRPCSRNGKRPCHRHDLACLEPISPQTVLSAVAAIRPGLNAADSQGPAAANEGNPGGPA
jgi:heptosyltransferase-2